MAVYKMNRNHLFHSKSGHTIQFKKGANTYVPNVCAKEVVALGAELIKGEVVDALEEETPIVELAPGERSEKIKAAFKLMMERQERTDFTAQGLPNTFQLSKLVEFEVLGKERDDVWQEYQQELEDKANG